MHPQHDLVPPRGMKHWQARAGTSAFAPAIPVGGIERRRTEGRSVVFRVKTRRKIDDGFGEVCLGDDIIVFAVFISVRDMETRCSEGEGLCDL